MKNKVLLVLFVLMCGMASGIHAQSATDSLPSVMSPEKKAEFKGGMGAWIKFLERNLKADVLTKNNAPTGAYRVVGNFLVDVSGNVTDIRIQKDPGFGAIQEYLRVIKLSSGSWTPAYDKGVAVPFRMIQSITLMKNF